jgi:hypothetical protein
MMEIVLVKVDRMIWSTEEVVFSSDGSRPASVMTCVIASPKPSDRAWNLEKEKDDQFMCITTFFSKGISYLSLFWKTME